MSSEFEQISIKAGFMKHNGGVLFKTISETEYEFKSTINENHLNAAGITHGGYLSALIDAGAGTAAHRASGNAPCVTISLDLKFIGASKSGDEITGFAKILKKTNTLVFLFCELKCNGKIITSASGVWKILKIKPSNLGPGVGIAIATAGIIVGAVGSTGLSTNLIIVIESIAKDNVTILLFLTIILCLLLGMGLPTTANYVVVASLMATVLVDVGNASGFIFPLIAVHLFVFYFGLMADVTPPVGLASYAAAAISGGDPLKTGLQAFWYSLRTGILPIVFLFNHELLLIGVENIWHALIVIVTSLAGILVFTSATQGWFINRLRWYEIIIFLIISISLLSPEFVLNKFYPKYNYQDINKINLINLEPDKEVRFKVTRPSPYGERYKLFVISKNTFEEEYNIEEYGIDLIKDENRIIVDNLKWNGEAKKSGFEIGDYISEFKTEN
ncbi:DUF3394 domain-containing protein, partial [Candidatus Pelagibacter sp.]|nr:DUF3394 domain-containing protein [Candidatus Pelagibacter sp.]